MPNLNYIETYELIFDVIFKDKDDEVLLCKQPDFNMIRCTINIDFNTKYPKNNKVGQIRTWTFYSWGMIEDEMYPSQNFTIRFVLERLEDPVPAPKIKTEPIIPETPPACS